MKTLVARVAGTAVVCAVAWCVRADVSAAWDLDADGGWSTPGNWTGGSAPTGTTGTATFGNVITASRTVTLDASPWTINALAFANTGSFGWTLTGGTLLLGGDTPSITVQSGGAAKVASILSGSSGLTKAGDGSLTLTGANTFSGDLVRLAGELRVGDGSNATASAGRGTLVAGNGSSVLLNFSGPATLANASVTSTGSMIQNVGSGAVTLTNGAMVCTIDGGAAGIILAKLLSAQFTVRGDVTFGADTGSYVAAPGTAGATMRIVNKGAFWWIGSSFASTAPTIDVAEGVTVSLNSSQGAGLIYYNNLTGPGSFTFNGANANQVGHIIGSCSLGGTLTAMRPVSFGNGGAGGMPGGTRIVSTANGPVRFNSTTDITYSGEMSGAGALVKTNANTLTLTGVNTYTGPTEIGGGTLAIGGTGKLNSGAYAGDILNNGVLLYSGNAAQILSGKISGTGRLAQAGPGTLTLSGYNTYTGTTRVDAGELIVHTGGACVNSVIVLADGAALKIDTVGYGAQWICAGITATGGVSTLEFDLAGFPVRTSPAPLQINGDVNLTGTVSVVVSNGFWTAPGTYALASYTGNLTGTGVFTLGDLPEGLEATLVNDTVAKRIGLSVTAIPTPLEASASVWTRLVSGVASGDWGTSGNWSDAVPDGADTLADFGTLNLLAASYVNNDAPRTVGSLRFADAAPSHDWYVTNAPLTLSTSLGVPVICVSNRQAYVYAGLSGTQGFMKDGPGLLSLYGFTANTITGPIIVREGTLYVYKGSSLKNTSGSITVLEGACLDVYASWDGNPLERSVYLSGNGINPQGALHIQANLTVNGPLSLQTDSTVSFENFSTINGNISAAGIGKNLCLSQPGLFEKRYALNVYGTVNLGTGALTFRSVPDGGKELGYGLALYAANVYSGGTVLTNHASLRVGHSGALGSGGVTLAPTTRLDLYANSVTLAWLSGGGGAVTDVNGAAGTTTLTVNQAVDTVFSGVISNGNTRVIALVKNGAGTLALSGTNTYTGATTVSNGGLCVDGSLASASVTIGPGSAFSAAATGVVGQATLGGTLAFSNNSRLLVDLAPPLADAVSAGGNVTIGDNVEVRLSGDQTRAGGTWKILESVNGTLSGDLVLIGGERGTRLSKDGNAIWLTVPPKGTMIRIL
ncbi:MAG: autotransporter-associated beta strand repeat-containing protein [Kiritimatiellae bacterium]|nr:autotransporter-associated beta strand repeat-containing protein [Kiritimatiellia bacterium]